MRYKLIPTGALLLHILLMGWIAVCKSPVVDEPGHLAAGISHWEFGTFDLYRVNPPLVRMVAAIPVLAAGVETDWMGGWADNPFARPEFPLGHRLVSVNSERCVWLFTLARWACLPFTLLGGVVCYVWARDLYGVHAGTTALVLWCFDPNVLGWGATICPDVPAASVGLLAAYAYWRWLRQPSWSGVVLAGLALGAAWLTKSTWLVLLGVWPVVWLAWSLSHSRRCSHGRRDGTHTVVAMTGETLRSAATSFVELSAIVLIGLYVLNAGYGFAGCLRPLGDFRFISRSLAGQQPWSHEGNRFRGTCFEDIPVPLPADLVMGVDVQRYEFETGKWSYLRGEHKFGGWWWYYLYALAVKIPDGTLVLFVLALVTRLWLANPPTVLRDDILPLLLAAVVLALVSSQTGFNRYLRYALPAVPFLYVWISRVALLFEPSGLPTGSWRQAGRVSVLACVAAVAVSSLSVWPHSLSYFNTIAGGPQNGHHHLLDANIDWGQDLTELKRWLDRRSFTEPLYVSCFGWISPKLVGINAPRVPPLLFDNQGQITHGNLEDVRAGWYAASVNHVMGYRNEKADSPKWSWLREFTPVDRAGYSIWIYHLTKQDVEAFRKRHGSGR